MQITNREELPKELFPEVEREIELIRSLYSHESGFSGSSLSFSSEYKRLCQYNIVTDFFTEEGKVEAISFLKSLLPLPVYNLDSPTIPGSVYTQIHNIKLAWLKNTSDFDQYDIQVPLFEFKGDKLVDTNRPHCVLTYVNEYNRSFAIQVLGWCDLMLQKEIG